MTTIPASEIVAVNPSVLAAGGSALDIIGLLLTRNTRVPIGTVKSFPDADSGADFFGPGTDEAAFMAHYFAGFDGSSKKPEAMLVAQYNDSAVEAYLRGGDISGMTLTALKALSGSLTVVMDGYPHAAGSINLSGATSFSSAATIISAGINASQPTEAVGTGTIGGTFTGSIAATTLTISAVTGGILSVGDVISGSGVTVGTTITALGTGTGGTGTYTVSVSQTVASTTITAASNVLNITATSSGTFAVGQTITGAGIPAGDIITALGSGTGGNGTYVYTGAKLTIASETITAVATAPIVSFDSVSGAFVFTSGIEGAASTAAFATGTLATPLLLTSATGAVLSQGAAATTPAAFMTALTQVTTNWVTFGTLFDPDNGSGNTLKRAFAAWNSTQNQRYVYVCWDTDITPTNTLPAAASLGQILDANGDSGTALEWAPDATEGSNLAAFVMGAAASIDFNEKGGRITFAFKAQAGITPTVTNALVANNLGGSPQSADRGNGYNFYGAYAQANANFLWFQRGFVTGRFLWLDAYINQIWLNNLMQGAILTLLQNARSIPYDASGQGLIETALGDPAQAGINFGAFGPGTISGAQVAQVNAAAGLNIANTLQTQGFYIQVLPASAAVRAARGSPPVKFFYLDRGSVQAITIGSVAVQ